MAGFLEASWERKGPSSLCSQHSQNCHTEKEKQSGTADDPSELQWVICHSERRIQSYRPTGFSFRLMGEGRASFICFPPHCNHINNFLCMVLPPLFLPQRQILATKDFSAMSYSIKKMHIRPKAEGNSVESSADFTAGKEDGCNYFSWSFRQSVLCYHVLWLRRYGGSPTAFLQGCEAERMAGG